MTVPQVSITIAETEIEELPCYYHMLSQPTCKALLRRPAPPCQHRPKYHKRTVSGRHCLTRLWASDQAHP
jgi:hypothetical protein